MRLPHGRRTRLVDGIASRASARTGYLPVALDLDTLAIVLASAAAGYPGDCPAHAALPSAWFPTS
ncbi:MAG: hypothetical protein ACRDRI_23190 [Pseudonocardiaceae bacterium]